MEEILRKLRKDALYLSHKCKDGNLQSVFSCIDIIWVLYDRIMKWDKDIALNDDRDFFIISKGQATLALYPILIEKGMFQIEEIAGEIGQFDSKYCIQTDLTKFAGGIENNAGSLGHGLPFAVGIAMANKIKKIDSRVFVLCGDGEFTEGTMWESCIFAGDKQLDNLCIIIDDNNSVKSMVDLSSLPDKLRTFNFDVFETNGHSLEDLEEAFHKKSIKKPIVIIAHTFRGYGSKTMMENDIWFHKAPNDDELLLIQKEVGCF